MKISYLIPLLLLGGSLGILAEEDPELQFWMKVSGASFDNLMKMEAKTGEKAVRSAERLGSVYENMIAFWRERNVNDALKWSEQGKATALALATAAYAGDNDKAKAALDELGTTCKQCHDAHREKIGENKYRFK